MNNKFVQASMITDRSKQEPKRLSSREVYQMMEVMNSVIFKVDKKSIEDPKVIYVISDNQGITKIGVTKNFKKRVKNLSKTSGRIIVKEFKTTYCSNAFEIERELHKIYAPYRINGEWFKCDFEEAVIKTLSVFLNKSERIEKTEPKKDLFDLIEEKFSNLKK